MIILQRTLFILSILFLFSHNDRVEAGLTSYLPSLSRFNPFSWFSYPKKNANINDRLDNSTFKLLQDSKLASKPVELSSNSTTDKTQQTSVEAASRDATSSSLAALNLSSSRMADMFTTQKPKTSNSSRPVAYFRINRKGKIYESRVMTNLSSLAARDTYSKLIDQPALEEREANVSLLARQQTADSPKMIDKIKNLWFGWEEASRRLHWKPIQFVRVFNLNYNYLYRLFSK